MKKGGGDRRDSIGLNRYTDRVKVTFLHKIKIMPSPIWKKLVGLPLQLLFPPGTASFYSLYLLI